MKTQTAIEYFGSVGALADVLKISRPAIYQWGEYVPNGRAYQIEVISHGELKANGEKAAA